MDKGIDAKELMMLIGVKEVEIYTLKRRILELEKECDTYKKGMTHCDQNKPDNRNS